MSLAFGEADLCKVQVIYTMLLLIDSDVDTNEWLNTIPCVHATDRGFCLQLQLLNLSSSRVTGSLPSPWSSMLQVSLASEG